MRRFKNPELRVTFTKPAAEFVGDKRQWVHTWLCTSNIHANNIIERVLNQYDPFQRQVVHIPLAQVIDKASQRLTDELWAA